MSCEASARRISQHVLIVCAEKFGTTVGDIVKHFDLLTLAKSAICGDDNTSGSPVAGIEHSW